MAKKKILTDNGQEILPITHEDCVLDNNGVSIGSKIGNINELATDSRTDLVSAINDILYYKNNIKQENENLIQENEELKQENENIRDTLAGLMQEGGYNITGEEDINNLLDMLILSGITISDIKQIECGAFATFVLKNDGSLWGCGNNGYGELGLGNTTSQNRFTQVTTNINNDVKQVACGGYGTFYGGNAAWYYHDHAFIVKNDGSLWATGYNSTGQLGLNDTTNRNTFTQVTTNINNDVKQVICGGRYTFIIKNDGTVWACGYNGNGNLGLNDTNNRTTFTQVTTNINNDVKEIVCGGEQAFILKNDGSLWATGWNQYGCLGLGDATQRTTFTQVTTNINNDVKQIAHAGIHTLILKNDGTVWSCGANHSGQLGLGTNDYDHHNTFTQVTENINNDVKQIYCGGYIHYLSGMSAYDYSVILKNDGSLWSCGLNDSGQLGLGDTTNRNTFTQVTTNINNDVKQVICGGNFMFILKNDGSLLSCGGNGFGQLGVFDNSNKSTITEVTKGFSY